MTSWLHFRPNISLDWWIKEVSCTVCRYTFYYSREQSWLLLIIHSLLYYIECMTMYRHHCICWSPIRPHPLCYDSIHQMGLWYQSVYSVNWTKIKSERLILTCCWLDFVLWAGGGSLMTGTAWDWLLWQTCCMLFLHWQRDGRDPTLCVKIGTFYVAFESNLNQREIKVDNFCKNLVKLLYIF
jgi:hypothetical protein